MTDQQFYTSTNTIESYCTKETRFSEKFISKDSVDACYENEHVSVHERFVRSFEGKETKTLNQKQYASTITTEICKNEETKSFIQQRVERLYGPGALAQGFFVMKRQKNRLSECGVENKEEENSNKHSKSMCDKLLQDSRSETTMKQSTSSPVLPVLRHLRPEFRAQLPIINSRKSTEATMQKSNTVPTFNVETKVNGHPVENGKTSNSSVIKIDDPVTEESDVKDGHYFLKILDNETNRLLKLADKCENQLEDIPDLPEDAIGLIRSASGKARLLVSQKMQQFKGLCTNNITQVEGEAFPTTNEDLQGFWDMVMLQINQVDCLFEDLEKLKKNNWKEIEVVKPNKSIVNGNKKKVVSRNITTANNDEARKQREAREAQRKRLIEEKRKAMRAKNGQQQNIEIFVPQSS